MGQNVYVSEGTLVAEDGTVINIGAGSGDADAHIADPTGAHAASAISVNSTNLSGTGTDLQTVLEELETQIEEGIPFSGTASDIPFTPVGTIAGTTIQTAVAEVATDAATALAADIATHNADTTSVHGITNTASLETTTGAQTKVDTHVNDTSAAHAASAVSVSSTNLTGVGTDLQTVLEELDDAITAGDVATHEADTTGVHGILDTADLVTWSDLDDQGSLLDPRSPSFGCTGDAVYLDDCVFTSGDATVTSVSGTWTSDDIGKTYVCIAAGTSGATKVGTIFDVTDETTIELDSTVSTSVLSGGKMYYGTDDSVGFLLFLNACSSTGKPGIIERPMIITEDSINMEISGLKLVGTQAKIDNTIMGTPAQVGTMAPSSLIFTYGGANTVLDFGAANHVDINNIALLFVNSALSAACAIDLTGSCKGIDFRDCLIATPAESVAEAITTDGIHLNTAWGVRFERCDFVGFDVQVLGGVTSTGYSNQVQFDQCNWGAYGSWAIENPGENWVFNGGMVHREWGADATLCTVNFMKVGQLLGDIIVTVDGTFFSDVNSAASASNVVEINAAAGGSSPPGSIAFRGIRTGGDTGQQFLEYLVSNPIAVTIEDISWSGGIIVDFGSATGVRLALNNITETTTPSTQWWAGTFPVEGVRINGVGRKSICIPTKHTPTGSAMSGAEDGVGWFLVPDILDGFECVGFQSHITTVSSSGIVTCQIRRNRKNTTTSRTDADMLTTKLTIDQGEYSSLDGTIYTIAGNTSLQPGDVIFVDLDVIGTGAKGLFVDVHVQPRYLDTNH